MITKIKSLVDTQRGLLDRRIFADEEIYQQELEQVFGRCWLFVGHESQIAKPNDFTANYMGEDPVLVTRDSKGKLHTFLNMCRHRGNRICRADAGNAPSFMCTYHGWTFATDGKLVGVPGYKEAYFEELDRSQWGLVEARTETYKGLIFATWDREAPNLLDYLGDAAWYLDLTVDRRAGGAELVGGAHRWTFKSNWKIPSDNFAGDGYHVPITHGSTALAGIRSTPRGTGVNDDPNRRNANAGNGHSVIGVFIGPELNSQQINSSPVANAYFNEHRKELEQRLGSQRARQGGMGIGTVFPNCSWLSTSACTFRVWHPRGPTKTEVWSYCFVDKDAPQEVKDAIRRRQILTFSPGGNMEQDDGDNFDQCTIIGKSQVARRYPANLQMGIGHEINDEAAPGSLSPATSEGNQRGLYARWAEIMDASSWSQISLTQRTKNIK